MAWLAEHRRQRTASIVDRLRGAREAGQLPPDADPVALGDFYAALLHGSSVQARRCFTEKPGSYDRLAGGIADESSFYRLDYVRRP